MKWMRFSGSAGSGVNFTRKMSDSSKPSTPRTNASVASNCGAAAPRGRAMSPVTKCETPSGDTKRRKSQRAQYSSWRLPDGSVHHAIACTRGSRGGAHRLDARRCSAASAASNAAPSGSSQPDAK